LSEDIRKSPAALYCTIKGVHVSARQSIIVFDKVTKTMKNEV